MAGLSSRALFGAALLFSLPAIGSAYEAEPPLWPPPIDTVVVTADRPDLAEILRRRTGFSTLVPLGPEAPGDRDLGDLLDRTAGIHVHRYGGSGSFSLASVRGSTPGQVKICIDGVPIGAGAEGSVNLSRLPLATLQHVEVYRGPQTVSFGGPPAAGVINLVSNAEVGPPRRVSIGAGQYGARNAAAQWSGRTRSVRALASGEYRGSDGNFPFLSTNGTPFNPDDDYEARRRNNDHETLHLLWKGSAGDPDRAWADYTGILTRAENGVPGQKNLQTEKVRFRSRSHRHQLSGRLRPSIPLPVRLETAVHLLKTRDRFENPDGEVGLSRAKTDNRTREEGARLSAAVPLPSLRQQPRFLIEGRRERFVPTDELKGETGESRNRRQRTIAVEDQLVLGRLRLEAAYRWVRSTYDYGGPIQWGQSAGESRETTHRDEGAVYGLRVAPFDGLSVKANRGRVTRLPTFPELFGTNGVQDGNPRLRPERGLQWDAGIEIAPRAPLRFETTYFERLIEDQVYLLQNSQRTVKADNLDRAWVRGVESAAYSTLTLARQTSLELQANHTWTEAIDVGHSRTYHGKRIPNLPRNEGYASSRLKRGSWDLRWEVIARSSSFWHRYNQEEQKTPGSVIHDLSLERSLWDRSWRGRVEVRNVGDERTEDIDGYPLPGRAVHASLTWTSD